ncbi:exocyst complex component 5-like isoform X2 [Paramacrobiotus metropolitanus]|uniref:exocyst complex component 5-like isoform X2 n=1 Tax=Paramacrobiotus metropolitanus TaxID=2943436 RepID=UPI0024457329|nr:exocyst complex component 5-like isoform X2 [Paramacrobiotus metropolitanus]
MYTLSSYSCYSGGLFFRIMPAVVSRTKNPVDPERLRQDLSDPHFDVDEFLENFIKQSAIQPATTALQNVQAQQNPLISDLNKEYLFTLNNAAEYGADMDHTLQKLDDLFEACVHLNAKALMQHRNAESTLISAEDNAVEQLERRGDMVKRRLGEIDGLEHELANLTEKLSNLGGILISVVEPNEKLKKVHKLLSHFVDLNAVGISDLTYPELVERRNTMEDYQDAAEILLVLKSISGTLELAKENPYKRACVKISALYEDIENDLVALFLRAFKENPMDKNLMQQTASVLQNFSTGYMRVINEFIQWIINSSANSPDDPFNKIIHACDMTYKLVFEIFPSPETVMDKFITYLACAELEEVIHTSLASCGNTLEGRELYLTKVAEYYRRIMQLQGPLSKFCSVRMHNILKILLSTHLDTYGKAESRFFRSRCNLIVQQYYDVLAMDFGSIKLGPIQMRAEGKDVASTVPIGSAAPAKAIPTIIGDYLQNKEIAYESRILSHSLALNILHELQKSASRAHALLSRNELASCLLEMGQTAIRHILFVHAEYGLDAGLRMLPLPEPKTEPKLAFFRLIPLAIRICDLVHHDLPVCLHGMQRSKGHSAKLSATLTAARDRLEQKITAGIEYCLNSAMHWVQVMLSQQKKAEYIQVNPATTPTAKRVVAFFTKVCSLVTDFVNNQNRENIRREMGLRFHREILDHFEVFKYSTQEGMVCLCELKEYKECVLQLKQDSITRLFEDMLLVGNLLVCSKSSLSKISSEISSEVDSASSLQYFLRLREDYQPPKDRPSTVSLTGLSRIMRN